MSASADMSAWPSRSAGGQHGLLVDGDSLPRRVACACVPWCSRVLGYHEEHDLGCTFLSAAARRVQTVQEPEAGKQGADEKSTRKATTKRNRGSSAVGPRAVAAGGRGAGWPLAKTTAHKIDSFRCSRGIHSHDVSRTGVTSARAAKAGAGADATWKCAAAMCFPDPNGRPNHVVQSRTGRSLKVHGRCFPVLSCVV